MFSSDRLFAGLLSLLDSAWKGTCVPQNLFNFGPRRKIWCPIGRGSSHPNVTADIVLFPQVMVPEAEARAGLTLKPQTFPLVVKDRPVMDVAFVQFLASVSGKVSCLGKLSIENKN